MDKNVLCGRKYIFRQKIRRKILNIMHTDIAVEHEEKPIDGFKSICVYEASANESRRSTAAKYATMTTGDDGEGRFWSCVVERSVSQGGPSFEAVNQYGRTDQQQQQQPRAARDCVVETSAGRLRRRVEWSVSRYTTFRSATTTANDRATTDATRRGRRAEIDARRWRTWHMASDLMWPPPPWLRLIPATDRHQNAATNASACSFWHHSLPSNRPTDRLSVAYLFRRHITWWLLSRNLFYSQQRIKLNLTIRVRVY